MVEKSIDCFFGKVSSAILVSTASGRGRRSEIVNAWLYDRAKHAFRKGRRLQNSLRVFLHAPVIPLYATVIWMGGFDYYKSRVPISIMTLVRIRVRSMNLGSVGLRTPWYKPVEHVVINSHPIATARMYNYLVISGTFRSVATLLLGCIWMELLYGIHFIWDGHYYVKPLMHDGSSVGPHLVTLAIIYVVFGFCIASYMKFSRRYAEEAIFTFALGASVGSLGQDETN